MAGRAAHIELVFEEPPAPQRAPAGTTTKTAAARRPMLVPPDYIAPESRRAHGTRAKYVIEKCRCAECRACAREYERERQRAISRPDTAWIPYVPAGRARRHLAQLAAEGIGLKTVAKISGVSHGTLAKLVYGDGTRHMPPSRRIRPTTEAKILAVTTDNAAGAQKIPAAPTWKLLDDLIGRGFTRQWIARQLGATSKVASLQIRRDHVRASTARKVEALYRRLDGVEARTLDAHRHSPWPTRRTRAAT